LSVTKYCTNCGASLSSPTKPCAKCGVTPEEVGKDKDGDVVKENIFKEKDKENKVHSREMTLMVRKEKLAKHPKDDKHPKDEKHKEKKREEKERREKENKATVTII
jgi:hypothetical protein